MADETLYDSLEEEFSSASSASLILIQPDSEPKATVELNKNLVKRTSPAPTNLEVIKEPSCQSSLECLQQGIVSNLENNFKLNCTIESETDYSASCDISSIVPLYGGDKNKTEIEAFKNGSSSCLLNRTKCEKLSEAAGDAARKNVCRRKARSIFTSHKNFQNSCSNLETLVKNKITKSYLDMFHARIGYPGGFRKKEIEDSVRSLFGDSELSSISDAATDKDVFKDAEDNDSDTSSFYYNQMETECKWEISDDLNQTPNASIVSSIPPSKHNSFSELLLASIPDKVLPKSKPRSKKANVEPIPVLGGLGPDITAIQDKLERRRKQLNYGQKASNRNRIKMMEINVLKNLKDEIKKSNAS